MGYSIITYQGLIIVYFSFKELIEKGGGAWIKSKIIQQGLKNFRYREIKFVMYFKGVKMISFCMCGTKTFTEPLERGLKAFLMSK